MIKFVLCLLISCCLGTYIGNKKNVFSFMLENNDIPPRGDPAKMARYIVHNSDYTVLSHITHQRNASGYPMGRVFSMSDGPLGLSTGTPYLYVSFFDGVPRDLKTDNKCGMTMSLVQGDYCENNKFDPEDPRCAQVMLIGQFEYIKNNTKEWDFAKEALFSRHSTMKTWPKSHDFQFGKLNIMNVQIVDYFGGSKYPTVSQYYNATPASSVQVDPNNFRKSIPSEEYYSVHVY